MKQIVYLLILFTAIGLCFSCTEEKEPELNFKEGTGTLWLSGGLFFCATQIRMENGDTLIPIDDTKIYFQYKSGDKLDLKFIEIANRESGCSIGKDCEIIDIRLTE